MGYSARYHAASLAAIFVALAVGILIGVGFASDIVTGTAEDLEESLASDLDQARAEVDDLESSLEAERQFQDELYPAVVDDVLRAKRVAVIGLGGLEDTTSKAIQDALDPSGGSIGEIAVVRLPPDLASLAETLEGREGREVGRGTEEAVEAFGVDAAGRLLREGPKFDELRGTLLSRYSGQAEGVDAVVVVREPQALEQDGEEAANALENGLVEGFRLLGIPAVGVERGDTDPSTIPFFTERGLSTVDTVDRISGKVALVFALCGASGDFGSKETADALIPDLLSLPCSSRAEGDANADGEEAGAGASEPGPGN